MQVCFLKYREQIASGDDFTDYKSLLTFTQIAMILQNGEPCSTSWHSKIYGLEIKSQKWNSNIIYALAFPHKPELT